MSRWILTLILLLGSAALAAENDELETSFRRFAGQIQTANVEALPTLSNGRVKPLHSLARETMLYITGKYQFWGIEALPFYLSVSVFPDANSLKVIEVREVGVREKLGLEGGRRHFSVGELQATGLETLVMPLLKRAEQAPNSLSAEENGLIEAYHQQALMSSLLGGEHLLSVLDFSAHESSSGSAGVIVPALRAYLTSLVEPQPDSQAAGALATAVSSQTPPEGMRWQLETLGLEVFYNKARLLFCAALGLLGLGLLTLFTGSAGKPMRRLVLGLSVAVLLLEVAALALRVRITGFAPVTNMYGTMIWVSLGMSLFTTILYGLYGQALLSGMLWIVASGILLLTESLPLTLSPDLDPVVAVLRSNFWLSTHVLTITISYSAFTLAMVIGNVALVRSLLRPQDDSFVLSASHLCYRLMQLGVFLITAGIILGGVWADYSWGRFWGWDPKETWALIVDLGYLAILHGRHSGHFSRRTLLLAAPAAYLLVGMAWYGVNFILATGLHSYGFSSGGTRIMVSYLACQGILYVLPVAVWY